jgi:hypothetical protein
MRRIVLSTAPARARPRAASLVFVLLAASAPTAFARQAPPAAPAPGPAVATDSARPTSAATAHAATPAAAPSRGSGVVYHGRAGETNVAVPRVDAPIVIDGDLRDAAWREAAVLTGFSQYQPIDGVAAADSTEVLVLYAADAIYFGIRAFEPHGPVNSTLADRDRIGGDDHVHIMLDTFNDRRRALLFGVNALGVQADGIVTDAADGRSIDLSPDFVFESKGRIVEGGYEVEIRIPFKSLRYGPGDEQRWGINVLRRVQHSGEQHTWTRVAKAAPSFLAQSGTLAGLTDLRRGLVLDVNPTATARRDGARLPTGAWQPGETDPEFGLNLRWGVTTNLTANATFNPDFSQVESDVGQVVYDPRQALFFPEKRPFFLEGNENFTSPNGLIYTRRIVQPVAAAKLSGKVAGTNIGVLSAVDDALYSRHDSNPLTNIVRVRRDVGAQSTLGLLYTDRVDGGDWNRVAAADARLVFGGAYTLTTQLAGSFTHANGADSFWRPLFDAQFVRSGRAWGFTTLLRGTHPEFRPDAGFISRIGTVAARVTPRRSFYPESGPFQVVNVTTMLDGLWTYDRFRAGTEPNDMKWHVAANTTLRGGWSVNLRGFLESFMYPAELYTNYYIERRDALGAVLDTVPYSGAGTERLPNLGVILGFGTPEFQHFAASGQVIYAKDDNFEEWASAWVWIADLNADWRPTERVRVNARYLEQRYMRYDDRSLVKLQWVPRAKLEYQVSRPVFLRLVGEYNGYRRDALRDDSRTNDPILIRGPDGVLRPALAIERGTVRADALFSYQPTPGTVIFAGYGGTLHGDEFLEPRALRRTNAGFFVKLSYLFRM